MHQSQVMGVCIDFILVSDVALVPKGIHAKSNPRSANPQSVGKEGVFDIFTEVPVYAGLCVIGADIDVLQALHECLHKFS